MSPSICRTHAVYTLEGCLECSPQMSGVHLLASGLQLVQSNTAVICCLRALVRDGISMILYGQLDLNVMPPGETCQTK